MKKKFLMYFIAAAVFSADQIIKHLTEGKTIILIPGLLHFESVHNTGISFGLFLNSGPLLTIATFIVLIVMILYAHFKVNGVYAHILSGLIIGGAAGNLCDRLLWGFVRDMICLPFVSFPVFNVADSAIVCGSVSAAIYILFRKKEEDHLA